MSDRRPPGKRRYPLGVLGWSIIGVFLASLACAVASPLYGGWLRDTSPHVASAATGQVVAAVVTSRRGPDSATFYVTRWQYGLWTVLSVVVWAPLIGCLGTLAWFYTLGRPRYGP